ncbi:Complement receptor type 1 [Chelonia mydas]|uniref:Complement receptor type 1 n=1 Tax=Chelonia mydas TaxID=8469 RepID=M7BFF8_CHEMY|nr:Complement receptor type 1 [Chelonia mydas]
MSPGLPCPALALGLLLLLLPGTRSDCGPPPKLNHAVPSDVNRTEGFPVDTQVTYRCSDGFLKIPGKSDTVVCLSNSQWSYINEFCGRKSCGHPGELLHGRAGHMTEFLFGAKIDLLCEDGYKLIGRPFIQCELKGDEVEWSKLPTCQVITCSFPPYIANGTYDGRGVENFAYNSTVTYRCDRGFRLIGAASIHCTTKDKTNGIWSGPAPKCNGQCGSLPRLNHAIPPDTIHTEGFPINTEVTYRCLDGFVKIPGKSDTVVCLSNSQWSNIEEFCGRKSCGVPESPEHGRLVDATNNRFGAKVNIICDDGYKVSGRSFIQCFLIRDQVEWSKLPTCQSITCSPPPNITNGMHNGSHLESFDYNSSVTYKCDPNFSLTGEASIHCTTKDNINGVWNGSAPECKAITCSPPPNITNGMHNGSHLESFDYNSSVTYKCDPNFSLTGEASIHCTTKDNINGVWNGSAPECKAITCSPPPNITNGMHNGSHLESFDYNSSVTYKCDPNFSLTGEASIHCTTKDNINGVWNGSAPECKAITCSPPPNITNGMHNGSHLESFDYNSSVTYKCDPNFSLTGEASIHCTTKDNINGVWNGSAPECKAITCSPPPNITNGMHNGSHLESFDYNSSVTYKCDPNFSLTGEASIHCTTKDNINGVWNGSAPECKAITCSPPPNITNGMHNGSHLESFDYNSSVTYKCDPNFSLTGEASIHCTTKDNINGVWNGSAPECKAITCSPPPNITNGMHNGSHLESFDYNSSVTYKCDPNFSLTGEASIHCTTKDNINGVWNGSAPECKAITCSPPPNITNGMHNGSHLESFDYNSSVTYKCDPNFSLTGEASIHCTTKDNINGVWNGSAPECKAITCSPPPNITNGMHNGSHLESFDYNSSVTYKCDPNFSLTGEASIHCTTKDNINGVWNGSAPECKAITCSPPPNITNGMHNGSHLESFDYNSSVTYKCDPNFSLTGEASIHCTTKDNINGVWNGSAPECKAITCSPPPNITNGMHNGSHLESFDYNSSVTYKCDPNFSLTGEASIHCTTKDNINGVWNGSAPECKAITCSPPPNITNGMHNGSHLESFDYNSSVTYKCDPNFSLTGEASIHCTIKDNINGVWNGFAPECKGDGLFLSSSCSTFSHQIKQYFDC